MLVEEMVVLRDVMWVDSSDSLGLMLVDRKVLM